MVSLSRVITFFSLSSPCFLTNLFIFFTRLHWHWHSISPWCAILAYAHRPWPHLARYTKLRYPLHARIAQVCLAFPHLYSFLTGISFSLSVRWLAAHGRLQEAERSIARVHGLKSDHKLVQGVIGEIANRIEIERRLASGWISCFRPDNRTLYRTLLGMSLQSFQQLTGANYFFYYGATIFQSVGIQDSFVTQIILGAVNFLCTFGGLYIMERVSIF